MNLCGIGSVSKVMVGTGSADRGASTGRLLAVDGEQVVIASEPRQGISAQVWFPRFGYALSLANSVVLIKR